MAAILQASSSHRALERRATARYTGLEAAFAAAKETVDSLENKIHRIEEQTPAPPAANITRPSFNLSIRSQALRMHRRGDQPSQIASALQIPIQEVELLLKVHRIVLENLVVTAKPRAALQQTQSA